MENDTPKTTVLDRIVVLTAKEHDPLAFELALDGCHLPGEDMERWRRIVETVLREALDIFLQQKCEP